MQRLEFSGAVRPIYRSLGVKRLIYYEETIPIDFPTGGTVVQMVVIMLIKHHCMETYWGSLGTAPHTHTHTHTHSQSGH